MSSVNACTATWEPKHLVSSRTAIIPTIKAHNRPPHNHFATRITAIISLATPQSQPPLRPTSKLLPSHDQPPTSHDQPPAILPARDEFRRKRGLPEPGKAMTAPDMSLAEVLHAPANGPS
jgi:hypothetical protein